MTTDLNSVGGAPDTPVSADGRTTVAPEIDLETRGLSRAVPGHVLVDDVSVSVRRGEVLAIVGPSGAGKSSFLRLLNRLDEPTGGTVLFKQRDYREIEPRVLRRRIGMVLQTAYLFPGTVGSNLRFGPSQVGAVLSADQMSSLLRRVGLAGYEDRDVSTLSGGEAQRVSLARTLANDPELLLLDEPTSALDEDTTRSIEELILSVGRDSGMACVIVTHNRAQAARMAQRTMYMERGHLIAVGSTKEILDAH